MTDPIWACSDAEAAFDGDGEMASEPNERLDARDGAEAEPIYQRPWVLPELFKDGPGRGDPAFNGTESGSDGMPSGNEEDLEEESEEARDAFEEEEEPDCNETESPPSRLEDMLGIGERIVLCNRDQTTNQHFGVEADDQYGDAQVHPPDFDDCSSNGGDEEIEPWDPHDYGFDDF
jgi:hypothetical protein